ncbi:MAG: helix-turn-helix domain-containing protein [Pseudomonadota bacterium]
MTRSDKSSSPDPSIQPPHLRGAEENRTTEPASDDASNEHFDLTYWDPPEGLEKYILTMFDLQREADIVDDLHPGTTGQLFVLAAGHGSAQFGNREDKVEVGPILFNAFEVAVPYRTYGPWRCFGVSFSPYGWAALTQAPLNEYGNRFMEAEELLGDEINRLSDSLIQRCLNEEISGFEACLEIAEWIRPRLRAIPDSHEIVIARTVEWLGTSLNPPVEGLFEGLPYSRRQIERLVLRYFGFTPRALSRKFRAVRAANLLAQPNLTDEGEAEIAEAFADQSHMIREIRRYCGYTPTRLGGNDDPMFQQLLRLKNLDRLDGFRTIG